MLLIARALAERVARDMGLPVPAIGAAEEARLLAYRWPGNVRELRNVIERGLITSSDGRLNLERALPEAARPAVAASAAAPPSGAVPPPPILTEEEMRGLERDNLVRALEACGWQVGGEGGAAARLGVPASTFKSRMKSLGVARTPDR